MLHGILLAPKLRSSCLKATNHRRVGNYGVFRNPLYAGWSRKIGLVIGRALLLPSRYCLVSPKHSGSLSVVLESSASPGCFCVFFNCPRRQPSAFSVFRFPPHVSSLCFTGSIPPIPLAPPKSAFAKEASAYSPANNLLI